MGFLDKLKEGADQAKGLAGQAVDRAKEEARELNLKRQVAAAEGELGRVAFDLVDQGALSHPSLDAPVERLRALRSEIGTAQAGDGGEGETAAPAGDGEAAGAGGASEATSGSSSGGTEAGSHTPPAAGSQSS